MTGLSTPPIVFSSPLKVMTPLGIADLIFIAPFSEESKSFLSFGVIVRSTKKIKIFTEDELEVYYFPEFEE